MIDLLRAALMLAMATFSLHARSAELRSFGRESWNELLEASKGAPAIVHFWGLSCGICLAELPEWGAFVAKHPGTRFVLINWDRRPQDMKRIGETLDKSKLAGVENWVLVDDFEERVRFTVDRTWIGELPRTRLIAADGKTTAFSGTTNFHGLDEWLREQESRRH